MKEISTKKPKPKTRTNYSSKNPLNKKTLKFKEQRHRKREQIDGVR